VPTIYDKLVALEDVGLGYVRLGQSATTLSGGEAQRVKLAAELAKKATGRTVYILDEPTTGLHFADIHKLLEVLMKLRDAGNTLIVIEHNLEVVKCADWILDLGPEGGEEGGKIVGEGTPEQIAALENSHTGRYLRRMLAE
jgi:excinuclease ABC subunit A